jgi:hypothetical protein
MNNESDYLWDKTGEPDPEIRELEEILARCVINLDRWIFRRAFRSAAGEVFFVVLRRVWRLLRR